MNWTVFATSLLTVVLYVAGFIGIGSAIVLPFAIVDEDLGVSSKPLLIAVIVCIILAALSYAFLAGLGVEVA